MISVSSSENCRTKKDGVSSIDFHLLENVMKVMMKVVFPVNFIQVKQWVDNYVSSFFPLMHYFHKSNLENVYLVNFKVVNQIVLRSKN